MFSPLEQFEVFIINIFSFPTINLLVPNYFLYLLIISFLFLVFGFSYMYRTALISSLNNIFVEAIYQFIASITSRHCGLDGLVFFPLFFLTFVFILSMNILGLVPFSFTLTGQLIIPGSFSFIFQSFLFFK